MHGASDARFQVIGILLAWTIVFGASYVVPMFIAPTGELYMRGLNRLDYWLSLQVAALVLAITAWLMARSRRSEISRRLIWLSRVPLLVAAAEILALVWILRRIAF